MSSDQGPGPTLTVGGRSIDGTQIGGTPGGYRYLARLTGWGFFPLGFLARFPLAIFTVGVTMLVAWARDSYGDGGLAAGALGVGSAIGAPVVGSLADRYGQRRVVQLVGLINAFALVAIVAAASRQASLSVIVLLSFAVGFSAPQIGPLARARWVALVRTSGSRQSEERTLGAAMSWESIADELTFVFGPLAVGVIALNINDYAPLLVAACITVVFVSWFAHHPTAMAVRRSTADTRSTSPARELFRARVLVSVLGMLSIGMLFGAMLVSVTAFAGARGDIASAGFLYAVMGVGSAISAFAVGLLPSRFWLPWRWVVGAGIAFACSLLLPMMTHETALLLVMFGVGLGLGPTLVSIFAVASHTAPAGRTTIVMTLVSSGMVAGSALSGPITGLIADTAGYSNAFWMVCLATALMTTLGLWASLIIRRPTEPQ